MIPDFFWEETRYITLKPIGKKSAYWVRWATVICVDLLKGYIDALYAYD
jgi:hypothetical protein